MLPPTEDRVLLNTPDHVNRRIHQRSREAVHAAALGGTSGIARRLAELDREWDIERVLEANAASLVVAGCVLGAVAHRRFFLLPALVGGFLLQHALQGWCPPLPVLRRLGVRTAAEIEEERDLLLAVRDELLSPAHAPSAQ
ncbi:MAG: DUF2892 domain-containing protein [Thauera sp.]|nr:DUF2892 domain-containing protein [Thauera sp.]